MMKIELLQTGRSQDEDANAVYTRYDIYADGVRVGDAQIVTDYDKEESDSAAYIERIDIDDQHRCKGIGTAAIEMISREHDCAILAPDSERSKALYERLGRDITDHEVYGYCDQGYGVYKI